MIMMDTNITDQAYLRNSVGYNVVCLQETTTADGGAKGGVSMIIWDRPQGCSIESTCFHRPNVVSCKVNTVKRSPLIEAYLTTSNLEHPLDLAEASTPFWD